MNIRVTDLETEEIIHVGDAEEFLDDNEWDEDLEMVLNELDSDYNKKSIKFYGNQCMEYIIEKIEKDIFED